MSSFCNRNPEYTALKLSYNPEILEYLANSDHNQARQFQTGRHKRLFWGGFNSLSASVTNVQS